MGEPIDEAITFYDDFLIDTLNIYYQPHQVSVLVDARFIEGQVKGEKKKPRPTLGVRFKRCPLRESRL